MILKCHQHRRLWVGFVVAALACFGNAAHAAKKPDTTKKSAVSFSPSGGAFVGRTTLKLASRSGGADIRYTLDGSEPGEASALYAGPLQITNSTLVKAKAFPKEAPPTATFCEVYTILDEDLANFSSNLPLVIVDSLSTNIVHERKSEAAIHFIEAGKERARLTNSVDFSGRCLINIRGRASLRYPKNSFTVKTIDSDGDPRAVAILGMPPEFDWVLYAPYPDKTLMRDVLAYELHRDMGHWAPRARFVEVFVNSGGNISRRDYAGVYVFEERVKRDSKRVNIVKLTPEDDSAPAITGGYIFKKDHTDQGMGPAGGEGFVGISTSTRAGFPTGPGGFPADPKGFQPAARVTRSSSSSSSSRSSRTVQYLTNHFGYSSHRVVAKSPTEPVMRDEYDVSVKDEESFKTVLRTNEFYFVEPEPDEITAVQKMWLKRHLNELEAALYGPAFKDPAKGYRAFIDPDSFIDYHLIIETTKNVDGFRFSVFFTKDRGGKIKADPIWDWNLSFGNANGKQGWIPEYWMWPQLDDKELTWYRRLFEDPDFGQRYVDRWSELRTNVFSTKRVLARIDEMAASLQEGQQRNFEKWPILGRSINPNYFVGSSYEDEVNWMKKFVAARLDWIEKQFPPTPTISWALQGQGPSRSAQLAAAKGDIYYTLDGSDPRASGGEIQGGAQKYTTGVPILPGQKLFARTREENRWSGPVIGAAD